MLVPAVIGGQEGVIKLTTSEFEPHARADCARPRKTQRVARVPSVLTGCSTAPGAASRSTASAQLGRLAGVVIFHFVNVILPMSGFWDVFRRTCGDVCMNWPREAASLQIDSLE